MILFTSLMQTDKVLLRQLAIEHQGGATGYEPFRRMIEASPLLYRHDMDVYTDEIGERHIRNIGEIRYLQQLIRDGKLTPDMLATNVYNTYYPSYVLHHHYSVFLPMLRKVAKFEGVPAVLKEAKNNTITGAFFEQTLRLDLHESKGQARLEEGVVKMEEGTYFHSLVTSPYITHAAFFSQTHTGPVLAIVQVRDQTGDFASGVKVRDLG
jgi:hypothetical protein